MKHDTTRKPKFLRLQRRLGLPTWQVVGILECLWAFVAENHPLGAFRDPEDFAIVMGYEGDINTVMAALVAEKWLIEHEIHGLIVNDWHEHCPEFIRKRVFRSQKDFISEYPDGGGKWQTTADNGRQRQPDIAVVCPTSTNTITNTNTEERDPVESEHSTASSTGLSDFPELEEAYPGIWKAIEKVHPRIKKPKPGSKQDAAARATLAALVRADKYSPDDVLAALRWVFCCESEKALFWRAQVKGFQGLRKKSLSNGDIKFGNIFTAYVKDVGEEA